VREGNKMKEYDLCVAYRIYPGNSKFSQRPIFQENKLKLAEICLESFKRSLEGVKVKLLVIFDRCPKEYEKLFLKRFKKEDLEFYHIHAKKRKKFFERTNAHTFLMQINLLLKQNFSENVYFSEDDYFYTPKSFKEMLKFLKIRKADFITPYDHPDYYILNIHNYPKESIKIGKYLWRTVGSTCCTFLTTKKILEETRNILEKYRYISDAPMWFALTKKRIFFGPKFWKFNLAIWYIWKQLLFGRKYLLWAPSPSIATHMEKAFLAPKVNWNKYIKKYAKLLQTKK
jgi:hypothetical protein